MKSSTWKSMVRVGAAPEVPCDEEGGKFDAIEFGLQSVGDLMYQDSENMMKDMNGVPAKGQYDPGTNQIWINADHPDHKDADGNWTHDAKVTVGHEAIHAAVANDGDFRIHGLGQDALDLEASADPVHQLIGSNLLTAVVGSCYGGGQF